MSWKAPWRPSLPEVRLPPSVSVVWLMKADGFFSIVPRTPLSGPLPTQSQSDRHIRPSDSSYSLRSHRSVSSVGSLDSHASIFSGMTGMTRWSTMTGSDSVSSGPDPFDGFQARTASLSIDPNLFRMKTSPDEVDEMPTAVPPAVKSASTSKKGKAQTLAERKKVSHARKVCFGFDKGERRLDGESHSNTPNTFPVHATHSSSFANMSSTPSSSRLRSRCGTRT